MRIRFSGETMERLEDAISECKNKIDISELFSSEYDHLMGDDDLPEEIAFFEEGEI